MIDSEKSKLAALLTGVFAVYRVDCSPDLMRVWWAVMRPFDYEAVSDAFNRHLINPDTGQFIPKPADIIKMMQGGTQDAALVAWAKVDRALRLIGTGASVAFDDPLIHRVLSDMGGWTPLGTKTEAEWPFVQREFENRYRGFRMRSEVPEYPPHLIGQYEAHNSLNKFPIDPPRLVGDPLRAQQVIAGGADGAILQITHAGATVAKLMRPADAVMH